jgi:ADP-heptose:LPS heptosyltransferase
MAVEPGSAKLVIPKADLPKCQAAIDRLCGGDGTDKAAVVVFGLGSFGDALQITPLLAHLRMRFSHARLVLVHPNGLTPGLLEASPDLDEVVTAPSTGFPWLRIELLRRQRADLIVNCRYVIEYELPVANRLRPEDREFVEQAQRAQAPWLQWVANFPFDNDRLWQEAAARGLNMYSLMATTAGFPNADFEALRLELRPEDGIVRRQLPERYFVVCNSAEALTITRSGWTKTLAPDQIAAIVAGMRQSGLPAVQLGAGDDRLIGGVEFDWRGKSSLREAAVVLRSAQVYIGPEGGLANLARAMATRAVIFFGSTPPEFFAFRGNINIRPRRCGGCWWTTPSYLYHCPRLLGDPECTRSIAADDIVAAARGVLP